MAVKIKICGITCFEDAELATSAGADYLGFIFVPSSSRFVKPTTVRDITARLGPTRPRTVGVFVDCTSAEVTDTLAACDLDIAQLHGDEPPEVAVAVGPVRVWKAVCLRAPADVEVAVSYPAAAVLSDTMLPGQRGGTGQTGDWLLAADLAARTRVVLAGGLNAGNVALAVDEVQPFALDVGSGVERCPGRKDPDKLRAFIDALRVRAGTTETVCG